MGLHNNGRKTYQVIPQRYQKKPPTAANTAPQADSVAGPSRAPLNRPKSNRNRKDGGGLSLNPNNQRNGSGPPFLAQGEAREIMMNHVGTWKPALLASSKKEKDQSSSHLTPEEISMYKVPKTRFANIMEYSKYFAPLILLELRAQACTALDLGVEAYQNRQIGGVGNSSSQRRPNKRQGQGDMFPVIVKRVLSVKNRPPWAFYADIDSINSMPLPLISGDLVAVWAADASLSADERVIPEDAAIGVVETNRGARNNLRMMVGPFESQEQMQAERRKKAKTAETPSSKSKPATLMAGITIIDDDEEPDDEDDDKDDHDSDVEVIGMSRSAASTKLNEPEVIVIREDGEVDVEDELRQQKKRKRKAAQRQEEGEEKEWCVVKLGNIVTYLREFAALSRVKDSKLLPWILNPNREEPSDDMVLTQHKKQLVRVIMKNNNLNESQSRAVTHAMDIDTGFAAIQGPPGTGKTKTLIALLNAMHLIYYQDYYDRLIHYLKPAASADPALDTNIMQRRKPPSRPKLLLCAPSNAAVDEVLSRILKEGFIDGFKKRYNPQLCRIGAGDRIADFAKPLTAEGQAENFLAFVEASYKVDRIFANPAMHKQTVPKAYVDKWTFDYNSLSMELGALQFTESNYPKILSTYEKIESLERNMARYQIAFDTNLAYEEKVKRVSRTYVDDAQIVFATLSGAAMVLSSGSSGSDHGGEDFAVFENVVIDEAAQATEPSCLIPLTLGVKRCVLVGDPQQLPATVLSSGDAGVAYALSLLERICLSGKSPIMLAQQYRMHPAVSSFPRRYFYRSQLQDDASVEGNGRTRPYHESKFKPRLGPYIFMDVCCGGEERYQSSIVNRYEADIAVNIYRAIKQEFSDLDLFKPISRGADGINNNGGAAGSDAKKSADNERSLQMFSNTHRFGIVTPYRSQLQALKTAFEKVDQASVEVDTVDSFQGREKEFVIFSCVRSNSWGGRSSIGFVRDVRRMNVGLTRAQCSLIILGNAESLQQSSADWKALILDAQERGLFLRVSWVDQALTEGPLPQIIREKKANEVKKASNHPDPRKQKALAWTQPDDKRNADVRGANSKPHQDKGKRDEGNQKRDKGSLGRDVESEKSKWQRGNRSSEDGSVKEKDRDKRHDDSHKGDKRKQEHSSRHFKIPANLASRLSNTAPPQSSFNNSTLHNAHPMPAPQHQVFASNAMGHIMHPVPTLGALQDAPNGGPSFAQVGAPHISAGSMNMGRPGTPNRYPVMPSASPFQPPHPPHSLHPPPPPSVSIPPVFGATQQVLSQAASLDPRLRTAGAGSPPDMGAMVQNRQYFASELERARRQGTLGAELRTLQENAVRAGIPADFVFALSLQAQRAAGLI